MALSKPKPKPTQTAAKKSVMGRPREHDRDQIALDLIEWAKTDDALNLNKFCAIKGIAPPKITDWAKEDNFFREAYELCKAHIGYRREEKLKTGEVHVKAYDLNATTYDHFLKQERRSALEHEVTLKSQLMAHNSEESNNKMDALCNTLKALQDRNISDTNTNAE